MASDQSLNMLGTVGPSYLKASRAVTLQCTPGIDIEYHVENGEMVIDKSNVPLTKETKDSLCPQWMREIL